MQAFTQHRGVAAVLDRANIDTDQIIPKQFLAKVTREGFGVHLFHDWRYLDHEGKRPNPEFVLNTEPGCRASVLLAGENFGCGSSREHAPWALADFGLRAIIAPSFADIFYQNAINNGLLPIALPQDQVQALMEACGESQVAIDLEACQVSCGEHCFSFEIDADARHNLLNGLDAIGLTLAHEQAIADHEARLPDWLR
ncbi:3-isopropylmalate dehydratase small subunit [Ferrimonas sediminicola]|uniref:3-isopropylmalate dehydratase small subunit n=1 Tax=Ferrimonas sediminicola TaxID=2569538 RepID=A0A4U1BI07_9GAMM|nr:3-isopropylmalate dehydratase small subunit [Ferrimonas sediminicola]TKB51096.1 3-isopropylmalate dehydratase small subunit [Ferrimonas sediminicola]